MGKLGRRQESEILSLCRGSATCSGLLVLKRVWWERDNSFPVGARQSAMGRERRRGRGKEEERERGEEAEEEGRDT